MCSSDLIVVLNGIREKRIVEQKFLLGCEGHRAIKANTPLQTVESDGEGICDARLAIRPVSSFNDMDR